MSIDWVNDIKNMHSYYGVHEAVSKLDKNKLKTFLDFRINFLQEELNELKKAKNAEEIVDALIDICVVAIGTLDAFNVNAYKAWDEVLKANMNKNVGIKEGRDNPLGLPDLVKPNGWVPPNHRGNHGIIGDLFKN